MSSVSTYTIISCCPQSVTTGTFTLSNLPAGNFLGSDLYIYTGLSYTEPTTGMEFIHGYCYQVIALTAGPITTPVACSVNDLLVTVGKTCAGGAQAGTCVTCGPPPPAYQIAPCCDLTNVTTVNIDPTLCSVLGNVWVYTGTGFSTTTAFGVPGNFMFYPDECYYVVQVADGWYPQGPPCTDFDYIPADTCLNADQLGACPICPTGLQYLSFRSCCGTSAVLFKNNPAFTYTGVREYLGVPVDGLENSCYSISIQTAGDAAVPTTAAYNALPDPPAFVEGLTFSTISNTSQDCAAFTAQCPVCLIPCYRLYSCDGQIFNTILDLSLYVNQFITISDADGPVPGVWFVTLYTGSCFDAIDDITVDGIATDPCVPQCYEVTGTGSITYIDTNLSLVTAFAPLKFCSYVYPQISGTFTINTFGDCVPDPVTSELTCPLLCFKLTNCVTNEIYNSNTQILSQYLGQIVTIAGYEGCWLVELNEGLCDCPINVSVLQSFTDCVACLPIINYRFVNCLNSLQVQYSDLDYSALVGQVVELGCGGCWIVEQIDYYPPSIQIITVLYTFGTCLDCSRTYYKLTDCDGIEADVYTYTDLSTYLNLDQTITLKGCPTCWTIEETREGAALAGLVNVENAYDDCAECGNDKPCLCSSIRNDGTVAMTFDYVDCTGVTQTTPLLQPGETSLRYCLRTWKNNVTLTNYVKYYGTCTNGVCPPMVYNVRSVTPGYNTPACSAEKFETISCKASQILYRNVLTLRYGISNCCPEEDEYWLVKKELIDIAALYNPAYPCAVPSCGCECNSCNDNSCNECRTCNS